MKFYVLLSVVCKLFLRLLSAATACCFFLSCLIMNSQTGMKAIKGMCMESQTQTLVRVTDFDGKLL